MEQKDGHSGESSAEGTHVEKEAVIGDDDPSMLIRTEERQGSLPGNVRVRLVLPSHTSFRRLM